MVIHADVAVRSGARGTSGVPNKLGSGKKNITKKQDPSPSPSVQHSDTGTKETRLATKSRTGDTQRADMVRHTLQNRPTIAPMADEGADNAPTAQTPVGKVTKGEDQLRQGVKSRRVRSGDKAVISAGMSSIVTQQQQQPPKPWEKRIGPDIVIRGDGKGKVTWKDPLGSTTLDTDIKSWPTKFANDPLHWSPLTADTSGPGAAWKLAKGIVTGATDTAEETVDDIRDANSNPDYQASPFPWASEKIGEWFWNGPGKPLNDAFK